MSTRNVIIIGSGPAGLTAALYSARANLSPLVIEGLEAGGQLMMTTLVENWPGHRDGIMGPDLMTEMRAQAEKFGAEIIQNHVVSVDCSTSPMVVKTTDAEYTTRSLIVATGASARLLGLPSERGLMGHGVSTCATCDGYFFRGLEIAVVGGGDSAMEEANFLTRFGSRVYLLHRSETLRASKIMVKRCQDNPKIEFVWNTVIEEALGEKKLEALRLRNVKTGEVRDFPTDAFFIAIGHSPTTGFLGGQLTTDANGYLVTHDGAKTNVEGVFACGDCQDHVYRQAITAAGSGCMAAIDCERWLESQHASK